MESNKILSADLLDLLFEGKNKAYGAYELRKTYNNRMAIAITGMALVCLLFFITRLLASGHDKEIFKIPVTVVSLDPIVKDKKKPEPIPVQPPKAKPVQVEIKRFTPPQIVKDDEAKDPPPAVEDLADTKIGVADQDGVKDDGFTAPPVEVSTGFAEAPKTVAPDYEKLFIKVEKEAAFPGGFEGWKRYLQRTLNANVASEDGAPAGNYTVQVQFIVDKEGGISNVQAIEVPKACPGCGPEAVKVIKNGPKWEPAVQNGRKVNYQAVQSVIFRVEEE